MTGKIKMETEDCGSFLLLKVEGELSERTASAFKKTATSEIDEHGHTHMVIDFSACSYVNSTGIAALNVLAKKLINLGGKLGAVNPSDAIRDVMAATSDDTGLIREYKNLEEAAEDLDAED